MCHEWILFSPQIANQDSVGFNSILQPQLFVHPDWADVVYPGGEGLDMPWAVIEHFN